MRSPPLRGGQAQHGWPYRGRPGDDARGRFLGGARSPRPCCEAVRKPRHNIIIEGKGTPGGLMGRSPGESEVSLAGVRSPPLRGGKPGSEASGERPGDRRRAVFSEGRGLRARVARPCASRGTSSSRTSWRTAGCLAGTCLGCTQAIFGGVRSPPLRGWKN